MDFDQAGHPEFGGEDLKVDHEGREIPELAPIETAVRPLAKLAGETESAPRIRAVGDDG